MQIENIKIERGQGSNWLYYTLNLLVPSGLSANKDIVNKLAVTTAEVKAATELKGEVYKEPTESYITLEKKL